jgi:hypothetical protein
MKRRICACVQLLAMVILAAPALSAQGPVIDDPLTLQNAFLFSEEGNPPGVGTLGPYDATRGLVLTLEPGNAARGIVTSCSVGGDFDVQVDYTLINWPSHNPYGLRLGAVELGVGSFGEVGIVREGNLEFYTVVFQNNAVHTATSA